MSDLAAAIIFYVVCPGCVVFGMWIGSRMQRIEDADQALSEHPNEGWRVALLQAQIRIEEKLEGVND